MAGRIPDSFIDDLLGRVDIVDVIEARVPLRKAGRDYQARCPFHDERSPSFTVSPAKQFYHCFGCGAHGTAIKFLMAYDGMEFLDAVEELANRVGLKVPKDAAPGRRREGGEDLYALLDAAAKFYQRQLSGNAKARAYLEARGVDAEVAERFTLGYAPEGWDALSRELGTSVERMKLLDQAGLLSGGEQGRRYDRFRDRLMFPIRDRRGRVIAFGGRVLGDGTPKYLNSPETPLFHKGRELYALDQVRQAHGKIPRLVVVEGYMDVIALFQHGVTEAVATLGTATTRDHAELLFRNSADVYFCFDGDRAGRQAAWRAVESVLPRMRDGRQAFFLFLPEGEDPDSLIRSEGAPGFGQRLQNATPLSEFFFAEQGKDVNVTSLDGKARLVERSRTLLQSIPDGAFRDLMLQQLDSITGVALAPVTAAAPERRPAQAQERSLVRTAIAMLVQQPALAKAIEPPYLFAALRLPGIALLVELIHLCSARPDISTGALLEHYSEREEGKSLTKLAVLNFPFGPEAWHADFLDALASLDRKTIAQRTAELNDRLRETGSLSAAEKDELRGLLATRSIQKSSG